MSKLSRCLLCTHQHTQHIMKMHFQTAECLVVGELATKDMIVVLNKVDQLPEEGRSKVITKAKKRLKQTLGSTKFAGCAMVPTAVKPGHPCFIIRVQLQCACQHCSDRLVECLPTVMLSQEH